MSKVEGEGSVVGIEVWEVVVVVVGDVIWGGFGGAEGERMGKFKYSSPRGFSVCCTAIAEVEKKR